MHFIRCSEWRMFLHTLSYSTKKYLKNHSIICMQFCLQCRMRPSAIFGLNSEGFVASKKKKEYRSNTSVFLHQVTHAHGKVLQLKINKLVSSEQVQKLSLRRTSETTLPFLHYHMYSNGCGHTICQINNMAKPS